MKGHRLVNSIRSARPMLLGLVLLSGCAGSAPAAECPACPECASQAETAAGDDVAETEAPVVEVVAQDEEPAEAMVDVGTCEMGIVPEALVEDVSDEDTAALVELVRRWVEGGRPALDYGRGTLYAKSEDDTGMDPPHPSFVGRDAELACGRHQMWLRERARVLVSTHASPEYGNGVRCEKNVCCYDAAMEYDSSGTFVFSKRDDGQWTLRLVAEVADNGTLGAEWIEAERAWVTAQLARQVRRRCRGEPDIAY